ncbi:MAG: uroporphyrinogen-III C-methyltransferase [Lautropia sp.]|nr:uroporphyrinogen-III C-methyltransferase [Lautropia sp.]
MSSEQHNNRHRSGSAKPAGDVSDAKIMSTTTGSSSSREAPSASGEARRPAQDSSPAQGAKDGSNVTTPPPATAVSKPSGTPTPQTSVASGAAQPAQASKAPAPKPPASAAASEGKAASGGSPAKPDGKPQDMASIVAAAAQPPVPPRRPESSPEEARRSGSAAGSWLLLLLVLGLAGGGWWYTQQRFQAAEREQAKRVAEAEARAQALEAQIQQLKDGQSRLQAQGSTLENRLAETASQREQLQNLFEDMARVRGDKQLAAAERGLELANQHLALSGNVRGAVQALTGAEQALADGTTAEAIELRRVILQDIERLKSLPEVDLTRVVARLDEVLSRVDRLPFLADPVMPADEAAGPGAAVTAADAATEPQPQDATAEGSDAAGGSTVSRWFDQAIDMGANAADTVWKEFTSLVQIRRIDDADRLLLAPDQKRSVRENLRLQLLNARINLLNRHEALFRQDLVRGAEMIGRYFDPDQPEVKSSLDILTRLQAEPLQLNLPSLSGSMDALAATQAESEKRH